jgi:hypothetical protein
MALPPLPLLGLTQSVATSYNMIFNDESEDEDTELMDHELQLIVRTYQREVPARIKLFIEVTIPMATAKEFQNDFRITRTSFQRLLELIGPTLSASGNVGRKKIAAEKQLLAVIWLLATPDSYRYE